MKAMMLLIVEVPTLDHAGYIQKEAERLAGLAARKALDEMTRAIRDKAYVSNVTVLPFGEGSTCALLADEVQRLHAVVDVLERPRIRKATKSTAQMCPKHPLHGLVIEVAGEDDHYTCGCEIST
jgi:hypothetical protein